MLNQEFSTENQPTQKQFATQKPAGSDEPTKTTKTTQPTQPAQPAQPALPTQPIEQTDPTEFIPDDSVSSTLTSAMPAMLAVATLVVIMLTGYLVHTKRKLIGKNNELYEKLVEFQEDSYNRGNKATNVPKVVLEGLKAAVINYGNSADVQTDLNALEAASEALFNNIGFYVNDNVAKYAEQQLQNPTVDGGYTVTPIGANPSPTDLDKKTKEEKDVDANETHKVDTLLLIKFARGVRAYLKKPKEPEEQLALFNSALATCHDVKLNTGFPENGEAETKKFLTRIDELQKLVNATAKP